LKFDSASTTARTRSGDTSYFSLASRMHLSMVVALVLVIVEDPLDRIGAGKSRFANAGDACRKEASGALDELDSKGAGNGVWRHTVRGPERGAAIG
jgi:hypothetical protein